MTDQDNIELPPLPPFGIAPIADEQTVRDYARAAVIADRERRTEQAKPAKTIVKRHSFYANADGTVGQFPNSGGCFLVRVSWTDDGRAWIDGERNRELARRLRVVAEVGYTAPTDEALRAAADALDGGVR